MRSRMITILLFAAACIASFLSICHAEEGVQDLLDRVRIALGHKKMMEWPHGLIVEGHGKKTGLDTRFIYYFVSNGRYRVELHSDLSHKEGFDGTRGWLVDATGMPGHLECKGLEVSRLTNWVMGGYWLDAACPLEVSLPDERKNGAVDRVRIRLPGGKINAMVEIDRTTCFPSRMTWKVCEVEEAVEYKDYRKVSGFLFPFEIVRTDRFETTRILIDRVAAATRASITACEPVTAYPDDTRFKDGDSELEIKRAPTGHIVVHPMIEGKDVGWFLLDTGAFRNVITTSAADKLKLERLGTSTSVVGIGGAVESSFRQGKTMEIGPMVMKDPIYVDMDLSFLDHDFDHYFDCMVGGVLGYDFFSRCLVDLEGEKIKIHPRGAWKDRKAPWQELFFDGNIPTVRCRLEQDLEGLFHIDTGSYDTVTFHTDFVRRHKLLEGRDVKMTPYQGYGVGGSVETFKGTISWFELGNHRFEKPTVSFSNTDQGSLADKYTAGSIGQGFLARLNILLDYPNKRIAFIPGKME